MIIETEEYKKLIDFLNKLTDVKIKKNEKKITITNRISKAKNVGTMPTSFVIRIIESDLNVDTSKRLVRSKMNVLFEKEYYQHNYNDFREALNQTYMKLKSIIN